MGWQGLLLFKVISFGARGDGDGIGGGGAEGNVRSGHKNGKWKRLDKVQRRDGSAAAAVACGRVGGECGRRAWGCRRRRATEIARVKVFPVEVSQSV